MIGGAKGIGIGIDFGIPNQYCRATSKPYIEKDVLDSLRVVASAYGKSNDDADRSIVKNLVDASNPFIISNAAYKLNSGYGLYATDFTTWIGNASINIEDKTKDSFHITNNTDERKVGLEYNLVPGDNDFEGYKIKVEIIKGSGGEYKYYDKEGHIQLFALNESKIYTLPTSYNSVLTTTEFNAFFINPNSAYKITQIPSYQGAFVTDGVDDLITSTKTVQEMLGGSNEITVVSMIHGIGSKNAYTNVLREYGSNYIRNTSTADGKTGIYGYTSKDTTKSIITDILGDKNDYKLEHIQTSTPSTINSVFSVAGWRDNSGSMVVYPIAWYWTIIANKVLTTDQINQVIAYFNLDRTLKPDILCNTIKQGISNENHAEFGDKLIDFSGNGRDIQLNNLAWDGDSGIGKYNYPNWKVNVTQGNKYARIVYYDSINGTYSANFKGITDLYKSYGLSIEIRVNRANTVDFHSIKEDGIYTMTPPDDTTSIDIHFGGENVYNASCDITITQIPSHAGALCLDGVNDFGKVTGLPIYKDYTVVADRELFNAIGCVLSNDNPGAFIFETTSASVYSFGEATTSLTIPTDKQIRYQTKYSYNGQNISIGAVKEGTSNMWLGTIRDNDARFRSAAIYSLMSFPYSMSEFLIERQLKKHKLGTLYPDMVEFRPIVKSNLPYSSISYSVNPGEYISVDSMVTITVTLPNTSDKLMEVSCNAISDISISGDNGVYEITGKIVKSPQKINLVISSYLTMLNNETLISNETLIKNE